MNEPKIKGRIFDIQRYSIHDGPGIRTVVFLKGCFFRCKWCCNPESQNYSIEKMNSHNETRWIGEDIEVEALLERLLRDRNYYTKSGGGVTLSGGEVLFQPEFTREILKALKENGIHTAIESTGCTDFETIKTLLPYLDLYLMDIKHIDNQKHRYYTTQSNEKILENAKRLAKEPVELIIRVPIIPQFNDTTEEIKQILQFTESLKTVKEIHFLPYHRLGEDKYEALERTYDFKNIESFSDERVNELIQDLVQFTPVKCQIGG